MSRSGGIDSAGGVLVIAAALVIAVYFGVSALDHANEEVYAVPRWGVLIAIALLALTVVGVVLVAWSGQLNLGAVSAGAAALAVLGVLAMFSFGLLALVAAAGLFAWPVSASGGRCAGGALCSAHQWPARRCRHSSCSEPLAPMSATTASSFDSRSNGSDGCPGSIPIDPITDAEI